MGGHEYKNSNDDYQNDSTVHTRNKTNATRTTDKKYSGAMDMDNDIT